MQERTLHPHAPEERVAPQPPIAVQALDLPQDGHVLLRAVAPEPLPLVRHVAPVRSFPGSGEEETIVAFLGLGKKKQL